MKKDFSQRLLVGLTAKKGKGWEKKLKEINKYKIKKIALFLEEIKKKNRKKLYNALLKSEIKEIPLVHIRHDTDKSELTFLFKKFKSRYFTIHEEGFKILDKWKGFYKKLYLELNYDGFLSKSVEVNKIGGFCIDLSHFKTTEEKWSKEFEYVVKRKESKYFECNHLNGYSYEKNMDMHTVKSLKDFDYLKTIPKFLFGKVIALEMYNSISEQLKFKKYLAKMLDECFLDD